MNCGNRRYPQPSTLNHQPASTWPASKSAPPRCAKLLENGLSLKVAEALKKIGYAHVTLDLQGYRRGSLNEVPPLPALQKGQARPVTKAPSSRPES